MIKGAKYLFVVLVAVIAALIGRELFPKEISVPTPPEIVTVWDTVPDTVLVEVQLPPPPPDTIELTRTVTVTVPDTVLLRPDMPTIRAATRVVTNGIEHGDSLRIQGLELTPIIVEGHDGPETQLLRREWVTEHFVIGAIESIRLDTLPPVVTYFERDVTATKCGFKALFFTIPLCDPSAALTAGWAFSSDDYSGPLGLVSADIAIGSPRVRAGIFGTTSGVLFTGASYRW